MVNLDDFKKIVAEDNGWDLDDLDCEMPEEKIVRIKDSLEDFEKNCVEYAQKVLLENGVVCFRNFQGLKSQKRSDAYVAPGKFFFKI